MGKLDNGMDVGPDKGKSRPEAFKVDWVETKRLDHKELREFQGDLKELKDKERDKLRREIETRGYTEPISAWRKGKILYVLNGHQRLQVIKEMAAQGLRIPKIPVNIIKAKNEKEAKLKLLALTSQYGKMTPKGLEEFIRDSNLEGDLEELCQSFRFPEVNLKTLIHQMERAGQEEGDDTGGAEAPATIQPGDLVEMGVHRLICGDSRDPDVLTKLMNGRKADMVLVDPPYGVDYSQKANDMALALTKGQKGSKHRDIKNDNGPGEERDYREWFGGYYSAVRPHLASYNTIYTFMLGQELHNLRLGFDDAGYKWGDYLIWVKNVAVLSRKDYHARHEFIMYGWHGRHKFYGGNAQTTVFEYPKPARNDLHPTMKPVEICADLILHGTKSGSVKLDPKDTKGLSIVHDGFLGSGSTLMACQKTGRACYGAEIDEHYCDVIVQRWSEFTGIKTIKINGKKAKWLNS